MNDQDEFGAEPEEDEEGEEAEEILFEAPDEPLTEEWPPKIPDSLHIRSVSPGASVPLLLNPDWRRLRYILRRVIADWQSDVAPRRERAGVQLDWYVRLLSSPEARRLYGQEVCALARRYLAARTIELSPLAEVQTEFVHPRDPEWNQDLAPRQSPGRR